MLKVLIANNMDTYLLGKSDGLTFKDVSSEDFENMLYEYNSTREVPDISCTRLKDEITRRYLHPEQYRHQ